MKIFKNLDTNDLENEIWKTIEDFPDYQISNIGRVKRVISDKSNHRLKIKSQSIRNDYLTVRLYKDGKEYNKQINRLVYETFKEKLKKDYDVHHINENKEDNYVNNLESIPKKEHQNLHHVGKYHSLETRKKISETIIEKLKNNEIKILKGENNGRHKLSNQDIYDIKKSLELKLYTPKQLSWMIDLSIIYDIKNEKLWSHIKYERIRHK